MPRSCRLASSILKSVVADTAAAEGSEQFALQLLFKKVFCHFSNLSINLVRVVATVPLLFLRQQVNDATAALDAARVLHANQACRFGGTSDRNGGGWVRWEVPYKSMI